MVRLRGAKAAVLFLQIPILLHYNPLSTVYFPLSASPNKKRPAFSRPLQITTNALQILPRAFGIELRVLRRISRISSGDLILREDGFMRAGCSASAAIDTGIRVNVILRPHRIARIHKMDGIRRANRGAFPGPLTQSAHDYIRHN
jgi:hypothetical protein